MTIIEVVLAVYFLNIVLSWAGSLSEARAHNIENTYRNIVDWCNNRNIFPPTKINDTKIDKHVLYMFVRSTFWITSFLFIYSKEGFGFAAFNSIALIITFRAVHGSFYYHFAHKLNSAIYPDGWQTDGTGKSSKIDATFNDSFISRALLFCGGLLVVLLQLCL